MPNNVKDPDRVLRDPVRAYNKSLAPRMALCIAGALKIPDLQVGGINTIGKGYQVGREKDSK